MEGYAGQAMQQVGISGGFGQKLGLPPSDRPTLQYVVDTAGGINKHLVEITNRLRRLADALSLSAEVTGFMKEGGEAPEPPGFVDTLANRQSYTQQHLVAITDLLNRIDRTLGRAD